MSQDNYTKIDYLDEDAPISDQKWCCVSFLSPEGVMNCATRGIKIRGVYDTREEAEQRAKNLHSIDSDFHVFVGEVGKWLPWDPDLEDKSKVKDSVYYDERLQVLMKNYKDNREKAKVNQAQRKQHQITSARKQLEEQQKMKTLQEQDPRKAAQVEKMRRKLAEKQQMQQTQEKISFQDDPHTQTLQSTGDNHKNNQEMTLSEMDQVEQIIKKQEELTKREKERLSVDSTVLQQQDQKVQSIAESMRKMKELYARKKQKQTRN